jgi:hypothetical protein
MKIVTVGICNPPNVATFPVFDIPPGTTVAYIGLWTLATGGTYGGCFDVTDEVFTPRGQAKPVTYQVLACDRLSIPGVGVLPTDAAPAVVGLTEAESEALWTEIDGSKA